MVRGKFNNQSVATSFGGGQALISRSAEHRLKRNIDKESVSARVLKP